MVNGGETLADWSVLDLIEGDQAGIVRIAVLAAPHFVIRVAAKTHDVGGELRLLQLDQHLALLGGTRHSADYKAMRAGSGPFHAKVERDHGLYQIAAL